MLGSFLASWLVLAAAGGDPAPDERLVKAEQFQAELEYEQARQLLLELLSDEKVDPQTRFEANLLAGQVQRILDRNTEARLHFLEALRHDPTASLPPNQPPKIVAFFALVKREFQAQQEKEAPAEVEASPAVVAPASEPVVEEPSAKDTSDTVLEPQPEPNRSNVPLFLSLAGAGGLALGLIVAAGCIVGAALTFALVVFPNGDKEQRDLGRWAVLGALGAAPVGLAIAILGTSVLGLGLWWE